MRTSLGEALATAPVVLDGGLATELEAAGHDLTSSMWSARLIAEDPDAVVAAHRRFLDAGARVLTTASYQTRDPRLLRTSVELADRARSDFGTGTEWVAASVGPYGAMLADGSEYRGRYGLSVAELRRWHRPRLQLLAESEPDVLALETVPCLAEVEALLAEIEGLGVPCWLSITCVGTQTRAGEPAAEAFAMAGEIGEVIAVGMNCTAPADATTLVPLARQLSGKPVVVYPNSGERWDAERRRWTGAGSFTADEVAGWLADGARLVGGCCRVGPEQIAVLTDVCAEQGQR